MARQTRISSGAARRLAAGTVPRRRGLVGRALGSKRQASNKVQLREMKMELAKLQRKAKKGSLSSADKARLAELSKNPLLNAQSTGDKAHKGTSDWIARRLAENAKARDLEQDRIQDRDFVNASPGSTANMRDLEQQKAMLTKKQVAVKEAKPTPAAGKAAQSAPAMKPVASKKPKKSDFIRAV
ncbi:MAG: hypothetical protein HOQ05_07610 [Corynebacteriales bacterium]|nr:hypothetical protein [Mycobacteriales bacterium]